MTPACVTTAISPARDFPCDPVHLAHHAAPELAHGFGTGNSHSHRGMKPALHFARVPFAQVLRLLSFPHTQPDFAQAFARVNGHVGQSEASGVHGAAGRAGVRRLELHVVETFRDPARLLDTQAAEVLSV